VMGLARDDPAAFGTSIVFTPDWDAEELFEAEHKDEKGKFVSPDSDNTDNLPHARLWRLHADDVVDDPAANPDGLFHAGEEIAQEADALLSYGLGLTEECPQLVQLDVDPDRVGQFVRRFLANHHLRLSEEGSSMADNEDIRTDDETADPVAAETNQPELTRDDEGYVVNLTEEDVARHNEVTEQGLRAECKRFVDAFGEKGGVWYAEGLSFDEARERESAELKARVAELEGRLAAVDRGEEEPAEFQVGDDETPETKATKQAAQNVGENLAPLAAMNAAALGS